MEAQIQKDYQYVFEQIMLACEESKRDPERVRLVVVTKGHSSEKVMAAYQAGARLFGENYPEEGAEKIKALALKDAEWHMIGHIQSRKANIVASNYQVVHTVDRLKVADRLNRVAGENRCLIPCLLEVNVSEEASKYGIRPDSREGWDELSTLAAQVTQLENLNLCGLMTIAPWGTDHETAGPYFAHLREIRDRLEEQVNQSLPELSMGMSADYRGAILEGATYIRVGTAILGERNL